MLKRIYGTVDENTFSSFCDRARSENLTIGEAFEGIVRAYAKGAELHYVKPKKEHAESTGIDYTKESNKKPWTCAHCGEGHYNDSDTCEDCGQPRESKKPATVWIRRICFGHWLACKELQTIHNTFDSAWQATKVYFSESNREYADIGDSENQELTEALNALSVDPFDDSAQTIADVTVSINEFPLNE